MRHKILFIALFCAKSFAANSALPEKFYLVGDECVLSKVSLYEDTLDSTNYVKQEQSQSFPNWACSSKTQDEIECIFVQSEALKNKSYDTKKNISYIPRYMYNSSIVELLILNSSDRVLINFDTRLAISVSYIIMPEFLMYGTKVCHLVVFTEAEALNNEVLYSNKTQF